MKKQKVSSLCMVLMLFCAAFFVVVGCGDRLPELSVCDRYDAGVDPGKPNANPDATFNVFAESVYGGDIVFDTDVVMDVWKNQWGSCEATIEDVTDDTGYGGAAWKFIVGAPDWFGIAIRFCQNNPINFDVDRLVDMSAYQNGYLNFMFKGSYQIKVGIMSEDYPGQPASGQKQAWLQYNVLTNYGLRLDGNWCTVKVPMSKFTNDNPDLDYTQIFQLICFASTGTCNQGYEYFFDEVYYSKE